MKTVPHRFVIFVGWIFLFCGIYINNFAEIVDETITKPVPLKAIDIPFPWYAASEVSGYAEVLFEVDEEGYPRDFVVLKATHRAFSFAVIDTIKETKFEPARRNGKPTVGIVLYKNHFVSDRQVGVRKIADETRPYRIDENTVHSLVFGQQVLDEPIRRIETTPPIYPEELKETKQTGGVLIEFYIDRNGFVRAPNVLSSSHEAFSESALKAIRHWKFDPPIKEGEPVTARARQQFNF